MIAYFVMSGDPSVDVMFSKYIWGSGGIGPLLGPLRHKNYGTDLVLILVEFYVEGAYPVFGPSSLRVKNYSTKNKDIAVAVPVTPIVFHTVSEEQRRMFVLNSTLDAINAVRARLEKRKLNIDFDMLLQDVTDLGKHFITFT